MYDVAIKGVVTVEKERFRINKGGSYPGIYIILNLDNKKSYIGSTRNIHLQLMEQEISFRNGRHNNKNLQADYDAKNTFIRYPLTRVELLVNKYCKDDYFAQKENLKTSTGKK